MAAVSSVLVGRDAELGVLAQHLALAAQGRGGVVLLVGEGGIGKTALALAVADQGMARGFSVSIGRALELSSAPPWLPLRPCLRSIGISRALLPVAESEVYGLWEEVLGALSEHATRTPMLWVLEDLHAADAQTLDLLSFLAHPLRALPVLIVITARAVDPLRGAGAGERLDRLARAAETITLGPLSASATTGLIRAAAGRSMSDARLAELAERAAGHPLFAIELARAPSSARAGLPSSVVQVVQERLAALPTETRELLECAAVLGRELRAATLARLVERLPAAVIDDLTPALRVRLLEELAPGQFQFSHALVRDAIHDALPATRRHGLHARAERVLAEQGDTLDRLVVRASHVLEAGAAVDDAHAAATIDRAVKALCADGAYDRAFSLFRQSLETRVPAPSAELLIEAARLALAAGLYAEHARFANDALAAASRLGDASLFARAALALGAYLRPGMIDAQLVRALQDALEQLQAQPQPVRELVCRVRARLAAALMPMPDYAIPTGMARAAIAEARALGDATLLREVLHVAASAMTDAVDPSETHALASELCELAQAAGDEPIFLRALVRRIVHALCLGRLDALDADVDTLLAHASALGHPTQVWRPWLIASMRALARGDFAASEQLASDIEELISLSDDPALAFGYLAHCTIRDVTLDEPAGLVRAGATYLRLLPQAGMVGVLRAMMLTHIALRLEDRAQVASELRILLTMSLGPHDPFSLAVAAEAAAFLGDRALLQRLIDVVAPLRERAIVTGQVDFAFAGPMERVLGLMQAALGEHEAAITSLRSARASCDKHGLRPWTARIDFELGRVLAAIGRAGEARASLEAAHAQASALPLPLVAQRAERLLATLAAQAQATQASAPHAAPAALPKSAPESVRPAARAEASLVREGEVWRASFRDKAVLLRDSRGLQLLARLLAAPGQRVHVLALVSDAGVGLGESDAGAAIDSGALARYRERLAELDDEIAAADSCDDLGRAERLGTEREALLAELRRAVGLGGRLRKVGSMTERARVNVTRRVRDALARIEEAHPELGRYLEDAVRTGTYCTFRP